MKWIMYFCVVFVIVVLLPAASFSRTVKPITYSFGTVSDGESESSIQYGTHTATPYDTDYDTPSKSLSKHPSRLAHHYYDPPTEAPSWLPENITTPATVPLASTTRRSRKKNDFVPRVSYIRKQAPVGATTTPVSVDPKSSTESITSPVRVRKKGRWLRVRNEIPVNEELIGETLPATSSPSSALIDLNRMRMNLTLQSPNNSSHSRPAHTFRHNQNSSGPIHSKPGPKLETPKSGTRSTSGTIKASPQKWSYTRSTSTTENPAQLRHTKNSSFANAQSLVSAHPIQVLHYTTEASSTEREHHFVTQKPVQQPTYNPFGKNVDQPYQPLDLSSRNSGHHRKTNTSRKTTPVPKYKEAYFRRPPNRPRVAPSTPLNSTPATQQIAGASNHEKEMIKYERPSVLTTEQPQNNPESEQLVSDLGSESADEPGTHHESLTYSDTEKTEKTEEILQDMEYPEEEEEEDTEADEENLDPVEESPSKILQKPIRYSYSSDQNISESQTHNEPQKADTEAKEKKSGGEKHRSAHHKSEGDKAEEDYESAFEYDKGKKGHSTEENRKQHQEEEQGKKKKLEEGGGHQELHHVSSKGEKGTLFGESGSHKKGHSTKGSHNVHKKNEFLKKHEFYDEHHEDDEHKKYGDYHKGHNYQKDHAYKNKHKDGDYSEGHKGKMGKNHHGHRFRKHKGHDDAFKHVDHYVNSEDYGEKGRHSEGKKWKYEML